MKEIKLIKVGEHYDLYHRIAEENLIIGFASTDNTFVNKLSLKNCQAIENGYDLYDLAKEQYPIDEPSFKRGFKLALEILGNKRFTLEDMMNCWNKALNFQEHKETLGDHIQLLQQTEWDVEIEMICPHPMDTYRCGLKYGCDGDGCNHPEQVPYLDADGCLILKRK